MNSPGPRITTLRIAAGVVIVAALVLCGWSFWRWQTQIDVGSMENPAYFGILWLPDIHQQRDLSWTDALPSVIPLLINAAGVALLLLARAARLERHALSTPRPIANAETGKPGGAGQARWRRMLAAATTREVMTTVAIAIVASCAFLVLMVILPLGWRTVAGVSMMFEFVDVFGVLSHVPSWLVLVALLLISLAIAILLFVNVERVERPRNGHPGSDAGFR